MAMTLALAVAACGGFGGGRRPMGPPPPPSDREQNIRLMLSYDANHDGRITRDELEGGLKTQFAAADANHDGFLDLGERQAENERRVRADRTGYSPVIDWNMDGRVDYNEFATTMRSTFEDLDRDHNGVLEGTELRVPRRQGQPPPMRRQMPQ
jgi:Ca2+-binding EF-hand superfamily protein